MEHVDRRIKIVSLATDSPCTDTFLSFDMPRKEIYNVINSFEGETILELKGCPKSPSPFQFYAMDKKHGLVSLELFPDKFLTYFQEHGEGVLQ